MPVLNTVLDIIDVSRYFLKFSFNLRCSYCMNGASCKIILASGSTLAQFNLVQTVCLGLYGEYR